MPKTAWKLGSMQPVCVMHGCNAVICKPKTPVSIGRTYMKCCACRCHMQRARMQCANAYAEADLMGLAVNAIVADKCRLSTHNANTPLGTTYMHEMQRCSICNVNVMHPADVMINVYAMRCNAANVCMQIVAQCWKGPPTKTAQRRSPNH